MRQAILCVYGLYNLLVLADSVLCNNNIETRSKNWKNAENPLGRWAATCDIDQEVREEGPVLMVMCTGAMGYPLCAMCDYRSVSSHSDDQFGHDR